MIFEMMGEKFDKNAPIAMQSDVFPRFIINCRDGRTIFKENDTLEFELIIFDNLTELFIQYIYVFETIGQSGLGPEKARYELLSVSDGKGNIIYKNTLLTGNAPVSDIREYISSRLDYCLNNRKNISRMTLLSSVMLNSDCKNGNKKVFFFSAEAFSYSIRERLSRLNVLEKEDEEKLNELLSDKRIINGINMKLTKIDYYIQNEQKTVTFPRFKGYIVFDIERINSYLDYFFACEKLCIGQNILLGFGRYVMG
ncbi:hypothetical protein M972_112830 [Acetivibrio thermocellus AD2]|jgi:hypothetical protein|nr:hypothetical protein AD2_02748 [Acetivibrio thermocellus AD2]ANV77501.1 hypothetical protein LQRI_2760 [Acetivibrio thermocellus DSM 2360]EIC03759.1 hypothetical protein YSBL_2717 [Acetivibrio thermocellus YS]PFH04011.1 hypothetical protein M972_112830 [Acetivibrio thermocellus AD2]CDG36556.1 hypothetical protein CTHBC1_1951 [Acetivibrio thermocellus BC1]